MTRLLKKLLLCLLPLVATAFTTKAPVAFSTIKTSPTPRVYSTALPAAVPDLEIVALVTGQYNYAFAVVCLGEGFWSFLKAPSVDHGIKTLGPAAVAALVLVLVSGPMISSGDVSSVGTGLWVATGVSTALGGAYLARLFAPFSPSPKEIAFLGLMVAIAGFFSFSQNLIVDGFVTLPSINLPSLPSLPSFELPF
jgi:hypothetical protein